MEQRPDDQAAGTAEPDEPPDPEPDPEVEDDGSVPEKQIQRWKNEGGAWHPVD